MKSISGKEALNKLACMLNVPTHEEKE